MPRSRSTTAGEKAQRDIEVALGGGNSAIYRAGDVIRPEHRGLPTSAADIPKGMTTQADDDEPPAA